MIISIHPLITDSPYKSGQQHLENKFKTTCFLKATPIQKKNTSTSTSTSTSTRTDTYEHLKTGIKTDTT